MKGQYLFYSFLPGVTAAVLTSQPVWAGETVGLEPTSSSTVATVVASVDTKDIYDQSSTNHIIEV